MSSVARAKSWKECFEAFHAANPHVYVLFEKFAFEMIATGRRNYASSAIFERVRWHVDIQTTGDPFKLNNNFHPYYSRLFMELHPEHAGFFRTRCLRSTLGGTDES